MLRSFYLFLALITPTITYSSPIITARVSVQPAGITSLSQISQKLGAPNLEKFHITQAELLVVSDQAKTLQPIVFVKGDDKLPQNLLLMGSLASLQFTTSDVNGWYIGTLKNSTLSAEDSAYLLKLIARPQTQPILVSLTPPALIAAIRNDPNFEAKIKGTPLAAVLDELSTLEELELRISTTPTSLRTVAILRAKAGSSAFTFLNQRLPSSLPDEHERFSFADKLIYGYSVYNPKATADYLAHLADIFKESGPQTSAQITELVKMLPLSGGYSAFSTPGGHAIPQVFIYGHWNASTAPEFIKAQYSVISAFATDMQQSMQSTPLALPASNELLKEAFNIGEIPVWKLNYSAAVEALQNRKLSESEAAGLSSFYALRSGSLLCAGNAEELTDFVQTLASPPTYTGLSKAFNHYPTIAAQVKIDSELLLSSISGGAKISDPYWQTPCPSIYLAASINNGQGAITWEIPLKLFDKISVISKETQERKKLEESSKAARPAAVKKDPAPPAPNQKGR